MRSAPRLSKEVSCQLGLSGETMCRKNKTAPKKIVEN